MIDAFWAFLTCVSAGNTEIIMKISMKISKRNVLLILFDIVCFASVAVIFSLLSNVAFDFDMDVDDLPMMLLNGGILLAALLVSRILLGAYNRIWRYTSTEAYFTLIAADVIATAVVSVAAMFMRNSHVLGVFVSTAAINALVAVFARCCYRLLYKRYRQKSANVRTKKNICIIGAGLLGTYLANELKNSPHSPYNPVCFIDDDKAKIGSIVAGLRVFAEDKADIVLKNYNVDEVIVAIANVDSVKLGELQATYRRLGCHIKIYDTPVYGEGDDIKNRLIRDFSVEDLLFRKALTIVEPDTVDYYRDKVVLITGGGGSIGSELCRQVAKCSPKKLIILDIYENNVYEVQQELARKYGDALDLCAEIGSVRDPQRLEYVFNIYKPQVVFHAAAHKHVPLMEHSCAEAIKNNVLGTYNTANAAEKHGVEKFILVSTDKAVNPTNIMGASKRLCEMVVQCRTDSKTIFAAVRFGNVLGSNGSVIPLFKRQIAEGGPVTITHRDIIRYFMTIPEASQLVMTAGAMAKDGELFVLDMGKPIKIYDLAVNVIRMSGFIPEEEIKIQEIGLRPGEKLYEELLMKTEHLDKTSHKLIFVEKDAPRTREEMEATLAALREAVARYEQNHETDIVKKVMKQNVPTFKEPEEVNKTAGQSEEMRRSNAGEAGSK